MTLCVSLRVPDGVVAAVDSLSTTMATLRIKADIRGSCPECHKEIALHDVGLPELRQPTSTSETALKMRSLFGRFAVTHFGNQFVHGKSVYRQLRDFELRILQGNGNLDTAKAVAKALLKHLDQEFQAEGHDMSAMPDAVTAFGLQVSGYDGTDELGGHTYVVRIGKPSRIDNYTEFGCTASGAREVVEKLWKQEKELSAPQPTWGSLSLQDAIDYADFLLRTTADYQRFAPVIPSVGGPVDIALVTHYGGFQWIRRKELVTLLEEGD